MKAILLTNVKNQGFQGDIVDVAAGYFRNFLLPKGFAVELNEETLPYVEQMKAERMKSKEEVAARAEEIIAALKDITLTFTRKVSKETHLYGSIAEKDIIEELKNVAKIELEKSQVEMKEHIKEVGTHTVTIHLAEGKLLSLTVEVQAEKEKE